MEFKELLLQDLAKKSVDSDIRILDFDLSLNSVKAKVLKFGERSADISISFANLPTPLFDQLSSNIAENCYHLAALLADTRTQELRELMTSIYSKISNTLMTIKIDERPAEIQNDKVLAVVLRISEIFEASYWDALLAFGIGREELITEIFRIRRKYKKNPIAQEKKEETSLTKEQIEGFWDVGKEIFEIKYSIRADEIPAAALRRLDPLPLSGLEEDADPFFVETYERVSRLAQSYGLSLVGE